MAFINSGVAELEEGLSHPFAQACSFAGRSRKLFVAFILYIFALHDHHERDHVDIIKSAILLSVASLVTDSKRDQWEFVMFADRKRDAVRSGSSSAGARDCNSSVVVYLSSPQGYRHSAVTGEAQLISG